MRRECCSQASYACIFETADDRRPPCRRERTRHRGVKDRDQSRRARSHRDTRTYDPRSVATIAERAQTSETTTREQLGVLAEDGFVEAVSLPDERGTWYRRTPRSVVLERAQQLLDSVGPETLSTRVTELREAVREFETQTGAELLRAAAIADADLDLDAATVTE